MAWTASRVDINSNRRAPRNCALARRTCKQPTIGDKLMNSNQIKQIICNLAPALIATMYEDSDLDEYQAAAANPKLWKRYSKVRTAKLGDEFDMTPGENWPSSLEEFSELGFEHVSYVAGNPGGDFPLNGWARHFINDVFEDGLDPTVITNEDDSEILAIFWHSD